MPPRKPEKLEEEEETEKKSTRPKRAAATKKRHHSEDEEEEVEEDFEDEEDESDSDSGKKTKKRRRSVVKKPADEEDEEEEEEEEEEEDSDDNNFNDTSGVPPKDFTSGAFVVAKTDIGGDKEPTLWRIDGKALLQKYLPAKDDAGKTIYKSTSTYSGWSVNNKDKYYAARVNFKVQSRQETIVELDLDTTQKSVKDEAE